MLYKKYSVLRVKTGEELESFSTEEAAESFMIMMQKRGESVQVKTSEDDVDKENPGFEIEGLDIEQPNIEYGSALDEFDETSTFDFDKDQSLDADGLSNLDFSE